MFVARAPLPIRSPRRSGVVALVSAVLIVSVLVPASAAGTRQGPASDAARASDAAPASEAASVRPAAVTITLTQLPGSFTRPVLFTHAGDSTNRQYVVEQPGHILVRDPGGAWSVFLDIDDLVFDSGNEQGLLGLAFHPQYETTRKFYVYYTNNSGDQVIREFLRSTTNPKQATRAGSRVILAMADPYSNHNGGHMAFLGGYLFIGTGDGGAAGDPGNRAQSLNTLLGKMLRINVNGTSRGRNYLVPRTNPYVGRPGLDEIWSRGLRNPWRWSFDRATMDLWIGDVGQNRYEEIDRSLKPTTGAPGRAANYGWRVMEGRHCFIPSSGCSTAGKVRPLVETSHASGNCSITGGYVYRGPEVALRGLYFFADFCSGRIWAVNSRAASPATPTRLEDTTSQFSSFGEDEAGNLYIVDLRGTVSRIDNP